MKKYWKLMLMAVGMSAAFTLASCNDDKDVVIDQIYYISTDPSATTYPTTLVCRWWIIRLPVGLSFMWLVNRP